MKLCQLCGHVDATGKAETCPKCGEGTWQELPALAKPEPAPVARPMSKTAPKRSERS